MHMSPTSPPVTRDHITYFSAVCAYAGLELGNGSVAASIHSWLAAAVRKSIPTSPSKLAQRGINT